MIKHKIEDRKPRRIHSAEVSIYKRKYKRIKELLAIKNFDELDPDEYKKLGIQENNKETIIFNTFDDNATLVWQLCSDRNNYYDYVVFYHPDGTAETLDSTYQIDDIEIETESDTYTVKLEIKEDPDTRLWDERFWEPDEILWNILFKHRGHKVEIATYGDWNNPSDMCLECLDCNQVILDAEIYTICSREDDDDESDE